MSFENLYNMILRKMDAGSREGFMATIPPQLFRSGLVAILSGSKRNPNTYGHGWPEGAVGGSVHIGCIGEWYGTMGVYDCEYCLEVFRGDMGDYYIRKLLLKKSREGAMGELIRPPSQFDSVQMCRIPDELTVGLAR